MPDDQSLRELEEVVDWEVFKPKLVRLHSGRAKRGRPPCNPFVILKILVLSYLYHLSQRQVEAYANDSLSTKWFLGMAVDQAAPGHSTLTKFKERIEKQRKGALLEQLL